MKFMSLALLGMLAFALTACKPSVSDVEEQTIELFNKTAKKNGLGMIKATNVDLVHESGNNYTGRITLECEGESEEMDIEVTCDGKKIKYNIPELTGM